MACFTCTRSPARESMSVICSMQAGQPVATTWQPGVDDIVPLAPANAGGDVVVLQVEAAAHAAAPIGLSHLLQVIAGVGPEQARGWAATPRDFFRWQGSW